MLDPNPDPTVTFPLVAMAQFNRNLGEIPAEFGGGNRYRVIWAPSRKILRFTSGVAEVISVYGPGGMTPLQQRQTPTHKEGECWILEQWVNPYRDCTEEQWNTLACIQGPFGAMTRLQVMGPFPRRGYYFHCENTYLIGEPSFSQIEKMILLVEDGLFRHTQWENYVSIQRRIEAGEKAEASTRESMIHDRLLIGGGESYSAYGGGRGTKTIVTKHDTRDLRRAGFSTKPGTVSVTPRRRKMTYDLTPHVHA